MPYEGHRSCHEIYEDTSDVAWCAKINRRDSWDIATHTNIVWNLQLAISTGGTFMSTALSRAVNNGVLSAAIRPRGFGNWSKRLGLNPTYHF